MKLIIGLLSVIAILLAGTIFAAGPGTRLGVWGYEFGLGLLFTFGLPVVIATGGAVIALLLALIRERSMLVLALIALVLSGAAASIPLQMKKLADGNPFIHDITTDFDNPPAIIAAADLPRDNPAAYAGNEPAPKTDPEISTAEAQRQAFPDIQTIVFQGDLEAAREKTRAVLEEMKMEVLAEGPVSEEPGSGWRVEATFTSTWFGFVDDFIVRLVPQEDGTTLIDLRSKSRVGISDLGANAARVRTFRDRLGGGAA
ncbi:MAG: DUF1499 domain-containing protein [Pseudomonadota bacterium]